MPGAAACSTDSVFGRAISATNRDDSRVERIREWMVTDGYGKSEVVIKVTLFKEDAKSGMTAYN